MARSYDPRQLPGGPAYDEGGRRAFRGKRRIGPIGAIVPGDHVEVARELARLRQDIDRKRSGGGGATGFIALWFGATVPGAIGPSGGVWRIPELEGASISVALDRATFRVESVGVGDYQVRIQSSPGGGAFTPTTVATLTLPSGDNEIETTGSLATLQSGDLLRITWLDLGIFAKTFTVQTEGTIS
jgi:hypothetical protein